MKVCRNCKERKPLADFSPNRNSPDGYHWWCRICNAAAARARYAAGGEAAREKVRLAMRKRRAEQSEAMRAYIAKWREDNPERLLETARARRERNIDRVRAYHRDYCRRWRVANRDRARAIARVGEGRRRARKLGQFVEDVDPLVVFERDEGICGICDQPVDPADYHVDHILGLALGGEHSYANVQLAHPTCNLRKSRSEHPNARKGEDGRSRIEGAVEAEAVAA